MLLKIIINIGLYINMIYKIIILNNVIYLYYLIIKFI